MGFGPKVVHTPAARRPGRGAWKCAARAGYDCDRNLSADVLFIFSVFL